MRFHCLGIQHTVTSKEYVACAFTQKVLKFCSMMTLRGHTVIHYGHEDSQVECTEHVTVISREKYNAVYGEHDFRSKLFKFDQGDAAYQEFNTNAIREVNARKQPGDWLLAFWGSGHQPICQGAGEGMRVCEPGIGYPYGHFAEYKIFESYAMYHAFTKLDRVGTCYGIDDTWSKEAVIPNYFELGDFVDEVVPLDKRENYFLFVGRIGTAKGVQYAIQMSQVLGVPLKIAGQDAENGLREVGFWPVPSHVEIIGHIDAEQKKNLMAKAKAVVCMSTFAEPFCGVHVEAMMSGTPVITADWGAFAEFNIHGVTGFRCRTLDQMIEAGRRIHEISPEACRKWAVDNFATERVATMYEAFFERKMIPVQANPTKKFAVWSEKKWALGRIGNAIQKYIPNVDFYNWSSAEENTTLWIQGKWREYDSIISNTTLLTLEKLYGIVPDNELLKRLLIVAHFPRFEGMHYFKETLEGRVDGPRYAGVSEDTCEEMKKYGVSNPFWIPFGADTDVFPWTHTVKPIRRLGIIGGKDRTEDWGAHEEYIKNKGLSMFSEICKRGNFEPVYIHGMNHLPPKELYKGIDALICCSELEAGPLGVFEAASCGVPVLTTRVGNVQHIKGIVLFSTTDEAIQQLNAWNSNLHALSEYTRSVTQEVRINWSMRTLIKKHLEPILFQHVTYESKLSEIQHHVQELNKIVKQTGEYLEGNIFGWDKYDEYETNLFLNKRLNLFNYSQKAHTILEIGFNAGHSCLMYLLSNPVSTIKLFDLGEHSYTRPCFEYLNKCFPGRLSIQYGDSRFTLPQFYIGHQCKFDLIHVDGGHEQSIVRADILNVQHFCSSDTVIISDDDDHPHIAKLNRDFFVQDQTAYPSRHQFVGRVKYI